MALAEGVKGHGGCCDLGPLGWGDSRARSVERAEDTEVLSHWISRSIRALAVSLALVGGAFVGQARGLVFETGQLSGLQVFSTVSATGHFTFDPGFNDLPGVDYSSATAGTPGSFDVSTDTGLSGSWSGTFTTPGSPVVFGVTTGTYSLSGTPLPGATLLLSGPITFSATPPLPAGLTDLAMNGTATVTAYLGYGYTFSGTFELTAVPEPGAGLLLALGLVALAAKSSCRTTPGS